MRLPSFNQITITAVKLGLEKQLHNEKKRREIIINLWKQAQ